MSDLSELKQKTLEGSEWRGSVTVDAFDDTYELTVRQLKNPETEEVMGLIDRDELVSLREDLPEDALEEYRDLQEQDNLDEEEQDRLSELQEEMEGMDPFSALSTDTLTGLRKAAKYGTEPDEEDMRQALADRAQEIEREYGVKVQEPADTKPALQDDIEFIIDESTEFISFTLGMKVLGETLGDEGNFDE